MNWALNIISFFSIISSLIVITTTSPVTSVVYLITVFILVAAYLVLHNIVYLSLVLVIVYVGAIIVLILFVIIIINLQDLRTTQNIPWSLQGIASIIFIVIFIDTDAVHWDADFLSMFQYITININISTNATLDGSSSNWIVDKTTDMVFNPSDMSLFDLSQVQSLGLSLYTHSFIYIILASFVFMLAMIGPIVITSNKSR
uniref:NADH-ubiquinone oxidoreductase chain 6 n=1 Tax=Austropuccinia psidii TaxID=181123 RepID=A0A513X035_9BASI|nr:NADH dehydrogenase subunit 6 [Austropuccinia psidii]QDH07294.1 NADH dehydrogenase subunit 6 [Austropuccinia psidii]